MTRTNTSITIPAVAPPERPDEPFVCRLSGKPTSAPMKLLAPIYYKKQNILINWLQCTWCHDKISLVDRIWSWISK